MIGLFLFFSVQVNVDRKVKSFLNFKVEIEDKN
ncbi:unnamed protein product [Brugia timori]|uniref:Uncharacterized protein n=1 Tax=Brugia timori TaxID=42155 RepID=A0A0R3QTU2_9BILA|nr:unnamed protein product [Brugia timori]